MIANSIGPDAEHPIERDKDAGEVGDLKHMLSGANAQSQLFICEKMRRAVTVLHIQPSLNIPKSKSRQGRTARLRETQISDLQEAEADLVSLDDGHKGSSSIQAVGQEEEGDEIGKSLRQMADLLQSERDLLPPDCQIRRPWREFRTRSLLLENEPPDTQNDPICVGQEQRPVVGVVVALEW